MSITSGLNKLLRVCALLRKEDKEMPLSRLQILLLVAKAPEDGTTVRKVMAASGLNQASVARSFIALGAKEPGGHITEWKDPEDPRRMRYAITPRGTALLTDVATMLD